VVRLGELLISARLISPEDLEGAMQRQQVLGGRLGDQLVAGAAISQSQLDSFLNLTPAEPETIADTGIGAPELMTLLVKLIHTARLATVLQFIHAIKLPPQMVAELVQAAVARKLLVATGTVGMAMQYELSEAGRGWAQEALKMSVYAGPAPVTLDDFCGRALRQKVTNEKVTFADIRAALQGYDVADAMINQIGPALNSGRAMLLYGPPGNGKTTLAQSFAEVFKSVIYVPYAVMIDGHIMRVFDPSLHHRINQNAHNAHNAQDAPPSIFSSLRREEYDARWVAVKRPFIVAGGELTLEMLDLRYDQVTGFYEAPLHIKALGGCFVIDDFGRQMVSPTTLLNRWIVPMESRVDYLKLHTGKSFSIPFEAVVIFSTNLDPEDLMDPAFLRRLPYKIEVGAPSPENYLAIFRNVCTKAGVPVDEAALQNIAYKITQEKRLELAAFHARFIIDQVVAFARFLDVPPRLDPEWIDYAIKNLKICADAPKVLAA
jgi:energy-coupling factor transporter ATP-binding protein EcfA2